MKIGLMFAFLMTSCCLAANAEPNKPTAVLKEPGIDSGFVGRPEFETRSGTLSAGTAFFAKVEDEKNPLLITAQHIFGPDGGLKTDVPRKMMAGFTKQVTLRDLVKGKNHTTRVKALTLPDTIDIAVFQTTLGSKSKAHSFAKQNPKIGDVIWLVASLADGSGKKILYRGIAVDIEADKFKCKFDNGDLVLRGASGAPYVNAQGEIVGLHTGSFKDPGNVAGSAISVETIMSAIKLALDDAAQQKTKKQAS